MFYIQKLTIDYLQNPSGISEYPEFSWVMISDQKNVIQTSYCLQVGRDEEFQILVYDSGKVRSDQSAQIQPKEFSMESLTTYYVRVKVWNNLEEESDWSKIASFITALMDKNEWKAEFISAETEEDKEVSKGTYVRGCFQVNKPVKNAYMVSTALGIYHSYLNGRRISNDEMAPGWTVYNKRLLYQTYEITGMVHEGENVLGAHLGAGWYKGCMGFERVRNIYGMVTAFAAQILIRYKDGSEDTIVTDSDFQGCDSPVVFSEIYDGEVYDARKEQSGWNMPGFRPFCWKPVQVVKQPKDVLVSQSGCKVKELIKIPARNLFTTPQGDTILDFGQNLTGWVHVKVNGSEGDKVILNHFEVLDRNGNVYTENLRSARETLTYICSGQGETWFRPNFTFQGFRYIRIATYPGKVDKENFVAYAVHSDMEDTGDFSCSNPLLNQLQHNISWGLKGNFLDIPTDCPQRDERLGWTGDAQIFCQTATFLKNTYPFFSKWLKDIAADQTPDGAVPHVVPDILSGRIKNDWLLKEGSRGASAWGDAAVIIPWVLYLNYGDTRIIEEQYESMKKWIDFMEIHSVDYIWKFARQFGDWLALDGGDGEYFGATPDEMICTAYYAYSAKLFSIMAKAIGNLDDSKKYYELYNKIKDSYQRHFIKNSHVTAKTQTAQIITLYFDLAAEKDRSFIIKDLLELLEEHEGHLTTGFVGTPYFCHVLSRNNCTKYAYELLLKEDYPSWLYQVTMGATTIWEHWDGIKKDGSMWGRDNSFNHYAYGAIGEWLYRAVVGIEADPEHPGYKHIIFRPQTGGGLSMATGSYESVYGKIGCTWRKVDNKVKLEIQVPVNTTATVILEQGAVPCEKKKDYSYLNGNYMMQTGSGNHHISYVIQN